MTALFDRKSLLEGISLHLSVMESCLKWHTERGHNDNAKILEDVVARFLGILCGWELKNLNDTRNNYPVGDLGDFGKRIAIQVTVDGTTKKVADTHAKAIAHHFSQDFDLLIICFLLEKAPNTPRKSKTFTPCTSPKIERWARPQINAQLNARDNEDAAAHLNRLRRAAHVLRDEMSAIRDILSPALPCRPCNLPFASIGTHFKGRDPFLDSLHTALSGGDAAVSKPVAIRGDGGIGKTCAAVEYAWRYSLKYSALLLVPSDSAQSLESGLAALGAPDILALPGHAEMKHPEQLAAVIRYLQTHPDWLLILDNADTPDAMRAVKSFLPRLTSGRILVTTRRNTVVGQFVPLDLDYLGEADSIALLEDKTKGHRRAADDDTCALLELAHLLDGLPLALSQAAAHIAWQNLSWREYLQIWHSNTAAALTWYNTEVMDYPRSLAVTYETSVAQLGEGAHALLQILSWFGPDPIPRLLFEIENLPSETAEFLSELQRLYLVHSSNEGTTFRVHRVLQEITRQHQHERPSLALATALRWVNKAMPTNAFDFATWTVVAPLIPHSEVVTAFADGQQIPEPTGRLLNQLGLYHGARANYLPAESCFRRALELGEATVGINHLSVASVLSNYASLLLETNRLEDAERMLRQVVNIFESSSEADGPMIATALNNLGELLRNTARFKEAEPLMRRALDLDKAAFGETHPHVARDIGNLASLLFATNRVAEAEPLMRRALAMNEMLNGTEHPVIARDLSNLAQLLQATNRLDEAEPMMRRALKIDENALGKQHPLVALRLSNLAILLQATGRQEDALPLLHRALSIYTACFGESHPHTAAVLNNLANLLQNSGQFLEAETLSRRALKILEDTTHTTHPNTASVLTNLSQILQSTNRPEEAELLLRRALAIKENALGAGHCETAVVMGNLALLLQSTDQFVEAEQFMRRSLEIFVAFTCATDCVHPHLLVGAGYYKGLLLQMGCTEAEASHKVAEILNSLHDCPAVLENIRAAVRRIRGSTT